MQLSKLESIACEAIRKSKMVVFGIKDICLLLNIGRMKAYNLIKSLKKKKAIDTITQGRFSLQGTDEMAIGPNINWPSYISFWSALSYYGFSDQMPKIIFLASTRYRKQVKNYKYVTIVKERFFGYTRIGEIIIADKEKAIIDSVLMPRYSGGISEIMRCIKNASDELDINKLIRYAGRIKSKAVLRRLGFILQKMGYDGRLLKRMRDKIGRGYELLDPSLAKMGNLDREWLLDINCDIE